MKKWYEGYSFNQRPYHKREWVDYGREKKHESKKKNGFLIIKLPNGAGKKVYRYRLMRPVDNRILEIASLLDCAMCELYKKKWWQFWK